MKIFVSAKLIGTLGLLLVLSITSSCTEFFSTSWASWAARNPDEVIPAVSAANVDEVIELAENDPGLSFSVLKKIQAAAKGAAAADAASLQAAALTAASNATGLGSAVINRASEIMDSLSEGNVKELLVKTVNDMQNLKETGKILTAMLDPANPAFDVFVDKASAEDLAIGAAILLASEAKKKDNISQYFDDFDGQGGTLTPPENLALELAKAASGKEGFEDRLQEMLDSLSLLEP